jgi:hypothetical protein
MVIITAILLKPGVMPIPETSSISNIGISETMGSVLYSTGIMKGI